MPPTRPIVRGDELLFYYTGLKYRATFHYIGTYPDGRTVPKTGLDPDGGAICLAALRRDGFISLDATEAPGHILTRPFTKPDGRLRVNADIRQGGSLLVEMLDGDGDVVATSKPIEGDQMQVVVDWPTPPDQLPAEKTIRLRFTLNQGSLYSYWFDRSDK